MNKLYDALEYSLKALEDGADLDAVLTRYPDLADELRPMLEAAIAAKDLAIAGPSVETMRRGRAKLLQRAGEMRTLKIRVPRQGRAIPGFQRLSLALTIAAIFLLSGTGLVRASSTSLPGESLYPVKRGWEDVRLLFAFDATRREFMQSEYENERLEEVGELLTEGRHASIQIIGVFTNVNGVSYISGIPVVILNSTQLPMEGLQNGAAVILTGRTNAQGFVEADSVQVLPSGSVVPVGRPVQVSQPENTNSSGSGQGGGTGQPSGNETNGSDEQPHTTSDTEVRNFQIEGTIESISNNTLKIDGQTVYLTETASSAITAGMKVKVEGYYATDGRFIVTKLETEDSQSVNNSNDSSGSGSKDNGDNQNDHNNENDGSHHDGGGGDGGGDSGGGGDDGSGH